MKISPNNFVTRIFPVVAFVMLVTFLPAMVEAQATGEIQWLSNVEKAKKIAAAQNKLVLLHFDASWCRPCKALETYVYRSSAVKNAIAENVVPVKLDADYELNLVNEYDVSMVPFDVIITPGGRVITERRSPADAENYAKMIANTSSASRMLEKEKLGPIAHQRKLVKNRTLDGQDPTAFRAEGPVIEEVGLSKDGSLLQRRQTANTNSKSETTSNPWVDQGSNANSGMLASANTNEIGVDDLERNQFLNRERQWVAPSSQTRRAKPERIVNDRYFEALADSETPQRSNTPTKPGPFSLASNSRSVTLEPAPADNGGFDLSLDDGASSASLSVPVDISSDSSGHGDFKVKPTTQGTSLNSVVEVDPSSPELIMVGSEPPKADPGKFCLKGKCPVTLITEGRWEDGDARFGIVHRNRTYIFASKEKLAVFRSNPDKYSPVLAGFDPVVYHEQGKLVEGLVENGVFMGQTPEQKVVLFRDAATRSKFQSSPKEYLQTIRQATNTAGSTSITR
ncbi:thioredoxin family protein [Mariniblastus fucicola]|uniref:Thiol:disulfide interchange protein n=1 Tax=Mariniblastus fucicola TaxID=980251 RepID=A0A5B9P3X7_9BACT|nr:thioredoxin family protein [Mariniblastus fucicola]QEG21108.1 thiol:disulfide interchange protein precursor [Mariniblastus fucicola]